MLTIVNQQMPLQLDELPQALHCSHLHHSLIYVSVEDIRQRPLGFVYSLIIDYRRDYTYIGERGDGPRGQQCERASIAGACTVS